ncbi:hypothetical protein 2204_scaffold812_00009 [Bacteriophage sp.]|nr:hypothetical protein 2204_scaffold812_00009 [Bacteriophage sp.]
MFFYVVEVTLQIEGQHCGVLPAPECLQHVPCYFSVGEVVPRVYFERVEPLCVIFFFHALPSFAARGLGLPFGTVTEARL